LIATVFRGQALVIFQRPTTSSSPWPRWPLLFRPSWPR